MTCLKRDNMKTEEQLMEQFMKEYPWLLDDDIPDAFDKWVSRRKNMDRLNKLK
jgi:hypothetical protein